VDLQNINRGKELLHLQLIYLPEDTDSFESRWYTQCKQTVCLSSTDG